MYKYFDEIKIERSRLQLTYTEMYLYNKIKIVQNYSMIFSDV